MENNNFNQQDGMSNPSVNREELPQFGNPVQQGFVAAGGTTSREPLPQFGMPQQPNFGQPFAPNNTAREPLPQISFQGPPPTFEQQTSQPENPEVEECVNAAFGKCLAAAIMAWFPIASIIAIVFGGAGLKLVKAAIDKANQLGVQPGGKNVAARVLGMVGKIAGIVMTIIYGLYFIIGIIGASLLL